MSALSEKQKSTFLARAEQIGHDPATLAAQGKQDTVKRVDSLEELRRLLGPSEEGARKVFSVMSDNTSHGAAIRAAQAHVFGSGDSSGEHTDLLSKSLPVEVRATSIEDKVLQENEVWDLGTSAPPVVVNLGTLTMKKGSRIVIRNTALSFSCQKLIRES